MTQDPALPEVALNYIEDMVLNNLFGHENLAGQDTTERGGEFGDIRLKDFGNFVAEGIEENSFWGFPMFVIQLPKSKLCDA